MRRWKEASLWAQSNWSAWRERPYSCMLLASDLAGWVLDEESKEIIRIAGGLGVHARMAFKPMASLPQCVHYTSQFSLTQPRVLAGKHRISVDYFHGLPSEGPEFAEIYEVVRKNHQRLSRIRVSCSPIKNFLVGEGIDPSKIHQISIGINPTYFTPQNPELKRAARERLGIPQSAVVIGSFQKDGNGWGEGLEPKPVKGPDVFLKAIEALKPRIPELQVLLTGPARGYVKAGLTRLSVPFHHVFLKNYSEIGQYFLALDAYIVASRVEGGPKAILESMVARVPIISTRVGQAVDIVRPGENGFLAAVGDAEALAAHTLTYLGDSAASARMLGQAQKDAQAHTYDAQRPLWSRFYDGFVEHAQ